MGLHQQALAGFSNTNADKGLARGAAVGTSRRALSNIEPSVTQSTDSSPILTALARHSRSEVGVPITDLSELGDQADHTRAQLAGHTADEPSKGSLLSLPGFQLGAAGASLVFRRNSGGGLTPPREERVHLFLPLLQDFLPYQARRQRHPIVRRPEIPRLILTMR